MFNIGDIVSRGPKKLPIIGEVVEITQPSWANGKTLYKVRDYVYGGQFQEINCLEEHLRKASEKEVLLYEEERTGHE